LYFSENSLVLYYSRSLPFLTNISKHLNHLKGFFHVPELLIEHFKNGLRIYNYSEFTMMLKVMFHTLIPALSVELFYTGE
jgi:hypothetical protein